MATKPVALLVGTGQLGNQIAHAVLDKGVTDLRVMVRSSGSSDPSKQSKLNALKAKGATFVEADIMSSETLSEAVTGIDTVISAIGNDPSSYIAGQTNLLEAAEKAGVKRFMPSDFTGDYHKLDYGDNFNTDMRKQFHEVLIKSSVSYISINNGAFMEVMFSPFIGSFDLEHGTFSYWGDGDEPCDFTAIPDVAKYAAEVVADESLTNTTIEVAGDVTTFKQLLSAYEQHSGQQLTQQRLGSVSELRSAIESAKATAQSPFEYLGRQYLWVMLSGKAKLDHIANDRYPHVQPLSFREFLASSNNATP